MWFVANICTLTIDIMNNKLLINHLTLEVVIHIKYSFQIGNMQTDVSNGNIFKIYKMILRINSLY